MFRRKIWIWIIVIVVAIFGGYKLFYGKKETTTYTTETVTRGDLVQTVSVTGEVKSKQQADLSFALTGRVESVLVDVGDRVKKGQRLATIDRSTFPQQLHQTELDIKIQKETLRNMKRDSNESLYSKNQRNAQEATIEKARVSHQAVLRQMRDASLYAPMDGVIVKRNIELGEMAGAGSAVFVLAEPDSLIVEANVPEVDIVEIATEQKAFLIFDALSEDDIAMAEIISVDPASTVIQDVVYYRIKMKLDNQDQRLKLGMSCDVDIVTASSENVLMVPQRAVKKEDSRKYVEILKANEEEETQKVERVYVETGISGNDGMIEIKNNLLKEGEKVITFVKSE